MRWQRSLGLISFLYAAGAASLASAQRAVATSDANIRTGQSKSSSIVGHVSAGDTVALVSSAKRSGYYHVTVGDSTNGWVYSRYLQPLAGPGVATDTTRVSVNPISSGGGRRGPGTPGTSHMPASAPSTPGASSTVGCGDGLWAHVYNPSRLLVKQQCVTVTGIIVDATNGKQADAVRHEADGDTHGWITLDAPYRDMLDPGNMSDEGGNLVFEIVCHYPVTQADAKASCVAHPDHTAIPPGGTHVEVTGTYVQDTNHAKWMEIHPVSKIVIKP